MNKKWLPILMVTTFSLSACNKPNQQLQVQAETTHSSSASLTTANSVDIKDDLKTLDLVANKYSQAMLNAQDALNTALQNKELNTFSALLEQLKTRTTEFNAALDATNFKSREVDALSEKFKQVHLLGLEIAQENSKNPPQLERINALKTQIGALQQSVLNDMRSLQYTAYTLPNPAVEHTSQQIKPDTEINVTDHTPVIAASDLSQDNAADIKHDLVVLSAVSQTAKHNAQDSFMDMQHALDSGNRNALMTAVKQITTRLHDLNQKYNAVTLKSTEVTEARERLKEENNLQIEMSNIILSASPDRQKFAELNNKWKNSQKMVELEMEALRIKANTAS